MRCPHCNEATLGEQQARQAVVIDVCSRCHGVWLDRGVIYEFSQQPQALERELGQGLRDRTATEDRCPRCETCLERGKLPDRDAEVEECPTCGGLWMSAQALDRAVGGGVQLDLPEPAARQELVAESDPEAREKAHGRLQDIAAGLLALPNLFIRSVLTLTLLYGLLVLALITAVQFGGLNETVALVIGVCVALLQYGLGPWFMDLSLRWFYHMRWVRPDQLPDHLRAFVERVCEEEGMKFPSFGIIDDGAPTAFTYGHVPGNARIVFSRGILELLEPAEVEAVIAHEMGHVHNWDMVLMTVAQLVPLLLFYIYRVGVRLGQGRGKGKEFSWAVVVGAYVLYIVTEYIVLWFSRTREYFADRFAGRVTKNPNALAMALVKIAYGLASQGKTAEDANEEKEDKKKKKEERVSAGVALRALNIFDDRQAVSLVVASSVGRGTDARHPDVENIKSAMQWDLWNPWAKLYELNSTHPLVAHRIVYLTDQAAHLGQEPLVVFDRRKPESYWDDFFVDLFMMFLPWLALLLGAGAVVGAWAMLAPGWVAPERWVIGAIGAAIGAAGLGSLLKTNFVYRRDFFPHLSVAALMHKVKVSGVRPVPATLTGNIIGKGVPGLIWSKDFVLRDQTGILFMDYQQPLEIWNFLFGLLRAGKYQGKRVRITGWFRRAPVPFLEVYRIEVLDDSLPPRRCYSLHARLIVAGLLLAVGTAVAALGVMM
ncbi:MAG TPA: M48 family metalloprotease [Gemmataceae bacterium]|nr:M48 family metalloprotease [Gemmataceae bacterium]